jgi:hypothetical protein
MAGAHRAIVRVVQDSTYPNMWRVKFADGILSDMVNLTRAKDAGATHVEILKSRIGAARAHHPGFEVPQPVLAFIAKSVTHNGRDLEGAQNFADTRCGSSNPSSTDGGSFSSTSCQDSEFSVRTSKTYSTDLKSWQETCFVRAEKALLTLKLFDQRNRRYAFSIERVAPKRSQ